MDDLGQPRPAEILPGQLDRSDESGDLGSRDRLVPEATIDVRPGEVDRGAHPHSR